MKRLLQRIFQQFGMTFIVLLCIFGSTSVVQSKLELVKDIQKLILTKINETASDFQPCTENVVREAAFGDMIEIRRGKGYFHWSVFCGNATVIQLNYPEFNKLSLENAFSNFTGQVELRNLMELAGKDFCRINNKSNESKRKGLRILPDSAIRKNMNEELQRNVTFYNVFNYNCEHFATKLKFGVPFSSQIEAVQEIADNFVEIVVVMFKEFANTGPTQYSYDGLAETFA